MFKRFLSELRHRRVLRTAITYAIVTAAAVEFTDIVTPVLGLPGDLLRWVIIVALGGFPIVILASWFFDLTSAGVVKGKPRPESPSGRHSHVIGIMLISLLGLAVVYLSYRLYWESRDSSGFERGKSIAVLPFTNIASESEQETAYFSDGVAEEILNALSKVEGLRVAARTSSFAFREYDVRDVGESLNVSVVLEGSVRRAGNQLRISAQLVDTSDGFQLWSEVYRHELKDVFRIQEEIAVSIVKALQLELLGAAGKRLVSPGTSNLQAYDKYLEGRNLLQSLTPSDVQQAKLLFEQAIELDADYAQAYTGLADAWIALRDVGNLSLLEASLHSHNAISRAIQLNNALPEAQASLGLCVLGGGDNTQAARQFQKAIELDPEYAHGYLLRANLFRDQGYLGEATRVYTQALALDPLNSSILENQALLFSLQGRFDQAIAEYRKALALQPDNAEAYNNIGVAYGQMGRADDAIANLLTALRIDPDNPSFHHNLSNAYRMKGLEREAARHSARARELAGGQRGAPAR